MTKLICHVSDLHGELPEFEGLGQCDIIVNSGDWMPTKGRRMGERIQPRST